MSPTLRAGYVAVTRCDRNARVALRSATDADRRQAAYWALVVRLVQLEDGDTRDYRRLFRIMTGDQVLTDRTLPALNPLLENGPGGSSADRWGYQRPPIYWPPGARELPSPRAGLARWHRDPAGAVGEAGLEDILRDCLG
jgi:hypothetical protein